MTVGESAMTDVAALAVIGYGLAGSTFHAPVIEAVEGLRVAAVVTSNADRAARARAALPGAAVLSSADDVWADAERYDGVVVATPNRTHVALATAAIEVGLPVVVDKPLAVSSAQAQSLVALARERGVPLTVYHNRRWDADVLTLRRLLEKGSLGAIHRFESRFERWRPVTAGGWRDSDDPQDGGGVLLDLGSHLVDQAVQLFGPVTSVHGEVDTRRPDAGADDDVFIALRHAEGVTSHLWASAVAAHRGPRLRALGSRAAYVVPDLDPQEAALRAGRSPTEPGWGAVPAAQWGRLVAGDDTRTVATRPGDYCAFYRAWRDALLHGGRVPVDPADAVETLRILEAAREAAARR